MASPTSHASSPVLAAQDITWAQFIHMFGEGTTWAAHTLLDRDLLPVLPMDIHVLICLDSLSFPRHRLQECSQDGK